MTRIEEVNADGTPLVTVTEAARLIFAGKVIVCPTDTGYAFAANALDEEAVARVFVLKGRSYKNPIHVAVSSVAEAARYAHINESAEQLARHFLPGALTMVLPKRESIPDMLVGGGNTIGIRVPDNKVMLSLTGMTRLPLTATSANISGGPTPYDITEVMAQLEQISGDVAMVLDQGKLTGRGLSTIVDLSVSPPGLLRQGLIAWEEIMRVLTTV